MSGSKGILTSKTAIAMKEIQSCKKYFCQSQEKLILLLEVTQQARHGNSRQTRWIDENICREYKKNSVLSSHCLPYVQKKLKMKWKFLYLITFPLRIALDVHLEAVDVC